MPPAMAVKAGLDRRPASSALHYCARAFSVVYSAKSVGSIHVSLAKAASLLLLRDATRHHMAHIEPKNQSRP